MKIETEDKKLKEEQDLLISWRRVNQIISCVSVMKMKKWEGAFQGEARKPAKSKHR